jgi:2-methylcitrate dehydratase PrpD
MTALEQLGRYVAESAAPSDAVRELVELHLIDSVGAWIAGAATAEGQSLHRFREAMRNETPASLGVDLATRCAQARLSEIDDIHLPSMTTPGGIVIPAAMSMARALRAPTADDVIAAILAGYEVMTRLGRAIDGPTALYRGIWPTYFAAPLGVAAVVARLLGLDARDTANALALALTFAAPGVGHHNATTTSRWLAVGNAAGNGLNAALATQQGYTSDLNLFEGSFLSAIYGLTPDIGALTDGLGDNVALSEVSFKPWCAARQTMAATQALRAIIGSGIAPESITEVQAFVLPPHLKMIDHGVIAGDRASHLTSLQYCMAVAAVAPDLAYDVQQSPPDLPPAVRTFMGKIKVATDDSLLADYPRTWPARVRVLAGADTHALQVEKVPGDPALTFDRAQVRKKFSSFVAPVLGVEKTDHVLARLSDVLATGQFSPLAKEIEEACSNASAWTGNTRPEA